MRSHEGAPGAVARVLRSVVDRISVAEIDRVWVFPPLTSGRRERGLVVVACYDGDGESRRIVTVAYAGELTSAGVSVETTHVEEGIAPSDRLDRVIAGVVSRSEMELGGPRDVEVGGDPRAMEDLVEELEPGDDPLVP